MIMKDWVYIGAHVERPDGLIDKIIRITEDKGILLEMGTRYYCRTELKPFKDKPTKTELIDKAIDDLGGDISNANYHGRGYNNLWANGSNYCLAADDSIAHIKGDTFCTIEEFEQRKKERDMEKIGNDTSWYDYKNMRMLKSPPVGEIVLVNTQSGERKAKVLEVTHNTDKEIFIVRVFNGSVEGVGDLQYKDEARPLDWDKLSKRKQAITYAMELSPDWAKLEDIFGSLYDAGMLKLPKSK
jgi:hypothetical protein